MIQVGIIGAGRIGQVHMKSVASGVPNAVIRSLADPMISAQAEQMARGFGIEHISGDYHEILEDPCIDAVLVCSPTDIHAKISVEAIRAGKHVFCEKPVDHELAKIDFVEEALKASPKKLKYQVGFNRRYDHNFRALRQAVRQSPKRRAARLFLFLFYDMKLIWLHIHWSLCIPLGYPKILSGKNANGG